MPQRVLQESWSDYDNKKKKGEDAHYFSCEESWEVDYLVKKISKHLRNKTESEIREAITRCCKTITGQKPRAAFVRCVFERLDPK